MRFHHQGERLAHQHRASSAEQANHNTTRQQQYHGFDIQAKRNIHTRPDDTARKKPEQHRQRTLECIQTTVQSSVGEFENRLNQRFDGIDALLVGIISQLRLTLQKQRDDMDKSFKQSFYGDTQDTNDDMDSNTDGDDVDKNDSEQEMNYIDDRDDDEDIEELTLNLRCSSAKSTSSPKSSTRKRSDSSNTTGVAPNSSPSACSQIEEIRDPFVGALTKRHSLIQLYEWLSVINSVTSVTMVTSQHLDLHLTFQLTVTELSLNTLPFSSQLNPLPLAWSGYAEYENFKPWKTKQSPHPRHPHCWFASSPQQQQQPTPQQA